MHMDRWLLTDAHADSKRNVEKKHLKQQEFWDCFFSVIQV